MCGRRDFEVERPGYNTCRNCVVFGGDKIREKKVPRQLQCHSALRRKYRIKKFDFKFNLH